MKLMKDIPPLSNSIWPYDTGRACDTSPPRQFNKFRCFVLCPFAHADIVMLLVERAGKRVEKLLNHQIEVYYAGNFGGPGAIHPDIWVHIKQADIVVVDATGYNPNVVYELGVAAAWRPIDTVIIIRDKSDERSIAFDLQPARQRIYDSRRLGWSDQLGQWLAEDMLLCLARVPFRDEPAEPVCLPFKFSFQDGRDTRDLWSPGPGHRRINEGALEFGSPLYFPYSWLSPVGIRPTNVRVKAEMRFTDRVDLCWIGIALRSQGYLANQEHLAWLESTGHAFGTGPAPSAQNRKFEHRLGKVSGFDPSTMEYTCFDVSMDSKAWLIKIGDVHQEIPLTKLPHVFGSGRILIQAYKCRAAVRRIEIEELETPS